MRLTKGLYEQVISKELNEEIKRNIDHVEIYKEIIEQTDASKILSTYLSYILNKGLNYYKSSKDDVLKQIDISNKIIHMLSELIEDEDFRDYTIDENNLLRGIFNLNYSWICNHNQNHQIITFLENQHYIVGVFP